MIRVGVRYHKISHLVWIVTELDRCALLFCFHPHSVRYFLISHTHSYNNLLMLDSGLWWKSHNMMFEYPKNAIMIVCLLFCATLHVVVAVIPSNVQG